MSDPFSGQLWNRAQELLTNRDRQVNGDHTTPLTQSEFRQLVSEATRDGTVSEDERALLRIMVSDANNIALAEGLSHTDFNPSAMSFSQANAHVADAIIDRGAAGRHIHEDNGQHIDFEQPSGIAIARDGTRVDEDQLRTQARGTTVTTQQLATPAGQRQLLENLGQLHGSSRDYGGHASMRSHTCGPTTLAAMAVNAGPEGLRALCQATLRADRHSEPAQRILRALDSPTGQIRDGDLNDLAESLYVAMDRTERRHGDRESSIRTSTMIDFLNDNPELNRRIMPAGTSIRLVDGRGGDGRGDHWVAEMRLGSGETAIYDPWNRESLRGGHLGTDASTLQTYRQATAYQISDRQ